MLAASSLTRIMAVLPLRNGGSLTGATVTLIVSVMLLLPGPLSVTVQEIFAGVALLALATVL